MPSIPLKPPTRVRASRGLRRRPASSLSRALEEALFREAEVLSEGYSRHVGRGRVYTGSTMITVDLAALPERFVELRDASGRSGLLQALEGSVRVRLRAMRLGCAEVARRVAEPLLGTAQVETRIHLTGDRLHIDVDLEVPVGLSSRAEQP